MVPEHLAVVGRHADDGVAKVAEGLGLGNVPAEPFVDVLDLGSVRPSRDLVVRWGVRPARHRMGGSQVSEKQRALFGVGTTNVKR